MQSNQRQRIEQAKFTYFPLGKAKEKKTNKKTGWHFKDILFYFKDNLMIKQMN